MSSIDEMNLFKETFDVIFQNSMDMIFLLNEEGNIIDVNIHACRTLGETLQNIMKENIRSYVKEKKDIGDFLENTIQKGTEMQIFTFFDFDKREITFHLSSTYIKTENFSYIVLICRDIQSIVDSTLQRKFIFELFQHDLLNKLHAEIGYIDFLNRLCKEDDIQKEPSLKILLKIRDITVRSIYLMQNTNINFVLQEDSPLSNQKLEDSINHAIRYLNNFFPQQTKIIIEGFENLIVLGDEYLYRIFVNLVIKMMDFTNGMVKAEIKINPPKDEISRIVIHFEDVVLSDDERWELMQTKALDRRKLDVAVTQTLLGRYGIKLKIENVKRLGEIVGTRMILSMPVVEWK
jgi:PAS domain S-box-containing protein